MLNDSTRVAAITDADAMRQVPIERDINIGVNGLFLVEVEQENFPQKSIFPESKLSQEVNFSE